MNVRFANKKMRQSVSYLCFVFTNQLGRSVQPGCCDIKRITKGPKGYHSVALATTPGSRVTLAYGPAYLSAEMLTASGGRIHDNGSLCLHCSTPSRLSQEVLHTLRARASLAGSSATHLNSRTAACFAQRPSLQQRYVKEDNPQSQSHPSTAM